MWPNTKGFSHRAPLADAQELGSPDLALLLLTLLRVQRDFAVGGLLFSRESEAIVYTVLRGSD